MIQKLVHSQAVSLHLLSPHPHAERARNPLYLSTKAYKYSANRPGRTLEHLGDTDAELTGRSGIEPARVVGRHILLIRQIVAIQRDEPAAGLVGELTAQERAGAQTVSKGRIVENRGPLRPHVGKVDARRQRAAMGKREPVLDAKIVGDARRVGHRMAFDVDAIGIGAADRRIAGAVREQTVSGIGRPETCQRALQEAEAAGDGQSSKGGLSLAFETVYPGRAGKVDLVAVEGNFRIRKRDLEVIILGVEGVDLGPQMTVKPGAILPAHLIVRVGHLAEWSRTAAGRGEGVEASARIAGGDEGIEEVATVDRPVERGLIGDVG